MFEPIHGSAFDIMGRGIANPIGTFWSASMLLDHIGEAGAAARLMRAIERVTADKALHTPDLGGKGDNQPRHGGDDRGAAVGQCLTGGGHEPRRRRNTNAPSTAVIASEAKQSSALRDAGLRRRHGSARPA